MNFKNVDFWTSVPPTRRIVYDVFALFFGAVMIPCLRRFVLLGNTVRNRYVHDVVKITWQSSGNRG